MYVYRFLKHSFYWHSDYQTIAAFFLNPTVKKFLSGKKKKKVSRLVTSYYKMAINYV